jgi:membrane protease YdiL (CAAX protease family)
MGRRPSDILTAAKEQWGNLRALPFKPVFVLLTATFIQLLARFHTSRAAFREMFFGSLGHHPDYQLYEHCFWLLGDFVLQFPLLLLLIRFVLKEPVTKYGLRPGRWKLGLKTSFILWMIMLPVLWIVSADPAFQALHPAPDTAKADWMHLAIFQACSIVYLIGWEFVWRGYVLFGLEEHLGYFAVIIQMIPFALLHVGAPEMEAYAAIVAGLGLGMLAFATRSFWYGVVAHALVLGSMDLLGALRARTGTAGIGISDLVELLSRTFQRF